MPPSAHVAAVTSGDGDEDGDILMAAASSRVPTEAAAGVGLWDVAETSPLHMVGEASPATMSLPSSSAVASAPPAVGGGDADGDTAMSRGGGGSGGGVAAGVASSAGSATAAGVGVSGSSTATDFVSRDERAAREQAAGALTFQVISNDGQRAHMIWLTQAKNIFAAQLPKMPREYIARLVYDRKHRTLIILKGGDRVVGGICYRPFPTQQFAEIAFLAISSSEQVKVRPCAARHCGAVMRWPDGPPLAAPGAGCGLRHC